MSETPQDRQESSDPEEEIREEGTQEQKGAQGEMHLTDHLMDLKKRLVRSFIAVFVGMLACYAFARDIYKILMLPLYEALPEGSTIIYTAPHEAFFTYIKVAFLAGLFLALPYVFYQIWLFVAPGLYSNERRYLIPMAMASALFFATGALFGYFVVFPFGYQFFMGFTEELIRPYMSMKEAFAFSFRLLIAFGVVFELPLVIFFLSRMGLVTSKGLRKKRKYAVLMAFIVSAVLTPPDLVTQTFMAGPLILLYELGIWVSYFFGKERKAKADKQEEEPEEAT